MELADQIISEEKAKEMIGISNWREMSKNKIVDFINLIPNIDREVAMKAIEQFPAYANLSKEMVTQLYGLTQKALESNEQSNSASIKAYQSILDELGIILQKENISTEERQYVIDKMVEVADKISVKDIENKDLLDKWLRYGGTVASGLLVLGSVILGVKSGKFPNLKG
ncbi:hypothetical protein [Fundicoccus ignavus]|uniref:Uncharacterized protein n=1 Tax=Fundicoccus ignavus TaxID=2664442 RepID=A0A844C9E8_9LACT|nr:hypothetical protein [Fundicoccus ignavus]MRJ47077.1 hypothetical protein [Fundicoccus ignavus]